MKSSKTYCSLILILFFGQQVFAQNKNLFYLQFSKKNTPISVNYDHCFFRTNKQTVQLYGHMGFGQYNFSETINTKFIKGKYVYSNTGSLLLDVLFSSVFSTKDQTIERLQYFDVKNLNIGTKVLLGEESVLIELGLYSQIDFVKHNIDAWDNQAAETKYFTKFLLAPSAAFRYDHRFLTFLIGAELHKVYGTQEGYKFPLLGSFGVQF